MRLFLVVSIFLFVLCGCRSSKVSSNLSTSERIITDFESNLNCSLSDTTRILRVLFDNSKFKYIETINIREYDAESGKPVKETEAKREIIQDIDKAVAEEEKQDVTIYSGLDVDHFADVSKKVKSEVKENHRGGNGIFWEYFGKIMGLALLIGVIFVYLKKRIS